MAERATTSHRPALVNLSLSASIGKKQKGCKCPPPGGWQQRCSRGCSAVDPRPELDPRLAGFGGRRSHRPLHPCRVPASVEGGKDDGLTQLILIRWTRLVWRTVVVRPSYGLHRSSSGNGLFVDDKLCDRLQQK